MRLLLEGKRVQAPDICDINEEFVGKELVSENEDIKGDKWVSYYAYRSLLLISTAAVS